MTFCRCLLPALFLLFSALPATAAERPPNIIFILADDLGYGELGCYGQKKIRTPNLDRMAAEGVRFTQFYAGNAVCAPSRCVLMTGKHSGHAFIRDNREVKPEGQQPIPGDTVTVAKLLKAKGYATGATGKWGLGPPGSEADPNKQGFDLFFGYNCQRHAHNHYPTYLWRNDKKVDIEGNTGGDTGKQHSHDLFEAEALDFIRKHKDHPFFLYVPFTVPHVALQVPADSLAEYTGKWDDPPYKADKGYRPHPTPRAAYAAMVTRLDRSVGRILDALKKLDLEEKTLVMFSSDNGPAPQGIGGSDSAFFESAGPLRGLKGTLWEGGIREPFIARWKGKIQPGRTSDFVGGFQDVLPTLCAVAGAAAPKDTDGINFLPTLLEKEEKGVVSAVTDQPRHEYLYWEFAGSGGQQAVRLDNWKGVRMGTQKGNPEIQLFDLSKDIGEKKNVAAEQPEVVEKIRKIMAAEHTPSRLFPITVAEQAVAHGLQWLALHQASDGHWSLHEFNRHARTAPLPGGEIFIDKCTGLGTRKSDIAGTALALRAFLGAGHTLTPGQGSPDYSKTVAAGLKYLVNRQAENGALAEDLFSHSLAAIALCESYALTADPTLKEPAQSAIKFIIASQDAGGGWGEKPGTAGNLSVGVWALMALQSGRTAGLSVPKMSLKMFDRFLDSCESTERGTYAAVPRGEVTPGMTAAALLSRQYLGINPRNPGLQKGLAFLRKNPPGKTGDLLYEYLATQVMYHMDDEDWKGWSEGSGGKNGIREVLRARQDLGKDLSCQAGSWAPDGKGTKEGGRLMATALALLSLEVEGKLPLYRRDSGPSIIFEK
jgi:arylsulfatase